MFPQKKTIGEVCFRISLLWILSSAFQVTAGQLCYDDSWKLHEATGTCMKVFSDEKKMFFSARRYCKTLEQGNGHLVSIFDEDTDNFVKDLLGNTELALIGLNYESGSGQYKWIDSTKPENISYFGWKDEDHVHDNPNSTSAVTITRKGWEEVSLKKRMSFVCQVDFDLAAVTQFNVQGPRGKKKVVQGQLINISCWAEGYPSPELELQKDGIVISQKKRGYYIHFLKTASCSDMGEYLCVARNTINNIYSDSKHQDIRVHCPPQHCDPKTKDPSFVVQVDTDIEIKFCVVSYPHPSVFRLFKVKSGNLPKELNSSKFNASYVHTNEKKGEGEINLKITLFKKKDIGHYQLYVANRDKNSHSNLKFHLEAKAFSSGVNLQLVVPVIIGLILVILVVVLITTRVIRHHQSKREKLVVPNKETKQTTIDQPSNSKIDDRRKELYANTGSTESTSDKPISKLVTKQKKPPEKYEQEEADTYAQVNKHDKKAKKVTKGKESNGKYEQYQANNYSQVNKFKEKDKSDNAAVTNNDDMVVYSNVSLVDITKSRGAGDPDNLYTNAAETNKLDKKKKENYSRTVTDDGLVYVSVDINKKTTNPEICSGNKVAMKPTNARAAKTPTSSKDQSVEYISLDFTSPFGQK